MVTYFQYLVQVISAADDKFLVVARNLSQMREVWKRMKKILRMKGAEPQVSGFFFKYVVQAVLLFG